MQLDRVWLGTVQLGLAYGLAKRRLSVTECFRQMDAAWDAGIRRFDTARIYGDAESRIGAWISSRGRLPLITSKVPMLEELPDAEVPDAFASALRTTLGHLGLERLDIYLCHHADDFKRTVVRDCLDRAKADGLIGGYGISCYGPEEAIDAFKIREDMALIQAPANILDRRVMGSSLPSVADRHGAILQLRSLYLQGALLMKPEELPTHIRGLGPFVSVFREKARKARLSPAALAVAYIAHRIPNSHLVIGFRSVAQIEALKKVPDDTGRLTELFDDIDAALVDIPPALVDPRTWK